MTLFWMSQPARRLERSGDRQHSICQRVGAFRSNVMKSVRPSSMHRWSALGVLTITILAVAASAQDDVQPRGMIEDWSHRHLVFANPGTYVQMLDPRVPQEKWMRWLDVQSNPR